MTRPRAADDFATIRARMEELRRERAQGSGKDNRCHDETGSAGRSLLKPGEGRQRPEQERWAAGSPNRRYGSGR